VCHQSLGRTWWIGKCGWKPHGFCCLKPENTSAKDMRLILYLEAPSTRPRCTATPGVPLERPPPGAPAKDDAALQCPRSTTRRRSGNTPWPASRLVHPDMPCLCLHVSLMMRLRKAMSTGRRPCASSSPCCCRTAWFAPGSRERRGLGRDYRWTQEPLSHGRGSAGGHAEVASGWYGPHAHLDIKHCA
jgi:hypothetical protein